MRVRRAGLVLACAFSAVTVLGSSALAQGSSENPPSVKGEVIHDGTHTGVLPRVAARPGVLPLTGSDLTLVLAGGCAAVGLGAALLRRASPAKP